jgi:hypothetical protein
MTGFVFYRHTDNVALLCIITASSTAKGVIYGSAAQSDHTVSAAALDYEESQNVDRVGRRLDISLARIFC